MIKSIIVNFLGIFNSRILGFIRDLLSANIIGANIYSDIFFVAFKFPNLFRRIFAEGAFTQSFIPSFSKSKYKPLFAYLVLKKLFIIILILSLIVTLFSDIVTDILAFGFSEEAKEIASPLIAINFWYLDFIFLTTFLAALLQYKSHFATTSFATALLNISLITALLLTQNLSKEEIIFYLSISVVIGGVLQFILHFIVACRFKVIKMLYIGYKSKKKEDISTFNRSFLPSIWGNSTAQISAFIDTWLATFLSAGSISYLYYANRLFQLPFALFVIASSIVFFPKVTKLINTDREKEAEVVTKKVFWILLYVLTFTTILTIINSKEIVQILFERGAFNSFDTKMTSSVLDMYMVGLIPYGLAKLFTSIMYANHQHIKAAKISSIALGVNIIFSFILITFMKVDGLALASSIGGIVLLFLSIKEYGFYKIKVFFSIKYLILLILLIIFSIFFGIVSNNLIHKFI